MTKLFVSYRRTDSADVTGRIFDRLKARFGKDALFKDVDSIPKGADFRSAIKEAVSQCQVLLVIIGPDWLTATDAQGVRRLDDTDDYVVIEVAAALERRIPVIPVLVKDTRMPEADDLPTALQPLAYRNAAEVHDDPYFDFDMSQLCDAVARMGVGRERQRRIPAKSWLIVVALAAILATIAIVIALTANTPAMKLQRIPSGSFRMGSPDSEDSPESEDEKPQHEVVISHPFLLGTCEVTQEQYAAVMGELGNPSYFRGQSYRKHPVEFVSWREAIAFCNALSQRHHLAPYYIVDGEDVRIDNVRGTGYRLPTEAEWEYACRAGTTTRFHFGDDPERLRAFDWCADDKGSTHPVGELLPNPWGLFDMHGNVREWCWDRYDDGYYATSPRHDPQGPDEGVKRLSRGGSYYGPVLKSRSAFRTPATAESGTGNPEFRNSVLGFRVARSLAE